MFEQKGMAQQKTKSMNKFWQNWLTVFCGAVCLFGVVLAGGAFEATSSPVYFTLDLLNSTGEILLNSAMRFSLAVMGAVTIGWSIILFAAIKAANKLDKQSSKSVWNLITLSVASWYVIDSILSIATGFWLNTIPNTIYMAAFLLPILISGVLKK